MSQKDLNEFVRGARAENEQRRQEALEKGGANYLKLEIGENKVMLQPVIPAERESLFGKMQYCFIVKSDGVLKTWTVTKNSPLAIKIVNKLLKAPIEITIVRSGEGKATRIDLKEKKE